MNYTEKYHLPQWEETDRVMMTDFNRMCAGMEDGLNANAQAAAAALSAANSKPTSEAVSQAQSAAEAAQSTANSALSKANAAYSPSYKPYVTGTYNGLGPTKSQTISVGFKPMFLIVSGQATDQYGARSYSGLLGDGIFSDVVTLTSTGFTIKAQEGTSREYINEINMKYRYLAFR